MRHRHACRASLAAHLCSNLRSWYGHEPSRWPEFQRRYRAELDGNDKAVSKLVETLRRLSAQGSAVTLLFAAHDTERNNAVVLREYLLYVPGQDRAINRQQLILDLALG
jgi:uncharacterized protein YeaO (DUF488 family)